MMKLDNWATCLSRYCHWSFVLETTNQIQRREIGAEQKQLATTVTTPKQKVWSPLLNVSFLDWQIHPPLFTIQCTSTSIISDIFFNIKITLSFFLFFLFNSSISEFLMCIVVLVQDSKGADSEFFNQIRSSIFEKNLNLIPIHDSSKIILTQLAGWFEKLSVIKSLLNPGKILNQSVIRNGLVSEWFGVKYGMFTD